MNLDFSLRKALMETHKNESSKCYLGNKEHGAMFLVVSRSDAQFIFEHTFFCETDGARK